MLNKFRQPIFLEDKTFSGKFHYFNVGEQCAGYVNSNMQKDLSLFIFQQCIGQKDKYEKEIYIGDILNIIEGDCRGNTNTGIYEVFYCIKDNALKLKCLQSKIIKKDASIYFCDINMTEVVGNIFDFELTT